MKRGNKENAEGSKKGGREGGRSDCIGHCQIERETSPARSLAANATMADLKQCRSGKREEGVESILHPIYVILPPLPLLLMFQKKPAAPISPCSVFYGKAERNSGYGVTMQD